MSFVTPGLLLGTLLVALPVVLHLVMRQQPRHVQFPPLRFLKARREANRRRLRLRHLLLLCLRCAAIGLLALALARPTIHGSGWLGGGEDPVAAALVFDTGPRMDYRHRNKTRIEVAQDIGLWLLRQLPPESDVTVLSSAAQSPVFAVDRGSAKRRIERMGVSLDGQPLLQTVADAVRLVRESDRQRREVYVLTDLARGSWPRDGGDRLKDQLAEAGEVGIYLVDVGIEDPVNYGLGALHLAAEVRARNTPLQIATDLVGTGPDATRSVELFVLDGRGQLQKKGHAPADWRAGQPARIELPPISLAVGTHQGLLRILGEDGLAWDDVRYFTVEVKPAWQVLVATPEPKHAVYLTEALAPESMRETNQARFACDVVPLAELNQQRLTDYAAVCLLDPSPLPAGTWQTLADYVAAGRGLAIFLGRRARPVDQLNSPAAQRLLPGVLKRQWRGPTFLAPDHLQHPVLAKFRAVEGSIPWQGFPVFKYWQIDPLAAGVVPIIRFATGHPALVEMPLGKGRVITMSTPISDPPHRAGSEPWNILPTGLVEPWPFVMLTNELMLHLVGSSQKRLNYLAGETVVLPLDADARMPMVVLETPAGDRLKQSVNLQEQALIVTSAGGLGNYRARAGGDTGGLDSGFSVNLPPEATRLERVTEEELAEILGAENFHIARSRAGINRNVNIGRVGRELFPYLIGVVALALACEHLVSNRFHPGNS